MAVGPQAGTRQLFLLEARVSYLEQILANLHIIADPPPNDVTRLAGGESVEALRRWGGGIPGVIADRATPDTTRLEALWRVVGNRPQHGDPPATDLTRLTASQIEAAVHDLNAEIVRLRSVESLLNERLREMRTRSADGSETAP